MIVLASSRKSAGCVVLAAAVVAGVVHETYAEASRSSVDIQVSESQGRVVLRYAIGDHDTRVLSIDGEAFVEPLLAGEPVTTEAGVPRLPKVCRSIIIPDDAEMAIRVLDADYYEVSVKVAPSKGTLSRNINPSEVPYAFGEVYGLDAFFPGELARLGEPYILRDYRGAVVELYPFQYNPVTEALRVYTDVTVEVVPTGPGMVNVPEHTGRKKTLSRAFHQIYKHHFVNYGLRLPYPPMDEEGDMLIIVHDPWIANVEPLATHKNGLGINTTVVGVSTIGNNATAIQDYVQSVYGTTELAFVLLVGDAAQVATPHASGGASDPSYAKLAGSDDYPDIMVGRFSAETTPEVDTQVQRTIEYEANGATLEDWFWRGAGIGSDAAHLDNIRDALLAHGYTLVDQLYDPDVTPAMIAAALNDGRGIINYVGHGGTTYWGTGGFYDSDVNALVNDGMLPFIFNVASLNGNFEGPTCFAESWLRARHNSEPTGAIAAYMSSGTQYWLEPLTAHNEFVNLYVSEAYTSFGTLCFAASSRMMDEYGTAGTMMFDTWILFGDPSLRIVGAYTPPTSDTVPTVSEWGLVVMTLLVLTAGTIMFARMRRQAVPA